MLEGTYYANVDAAPSSTDISDRHHAASSSEVLVYKVKFTKYPVENTFNPCLTARRFRPICIFACQIHFTECLYSIINTLLCSCFFFQLGVCIMKFDSNKDPRVWSVVLTSIFNIIIKLFTCIAGQHDGTRGWPEFFFGGKK